MNAVEKHIQESVIKNIEDVKVFIKFLCDYYYVDYYGEEIHTFTGSTILGQVSRPLKADPKGKLFRHGQRYSRSKQGWKLEINSAIFRKRQDVIKATLIHEFAHILQHEWMNDTEISGFKKTNTSQMYGHITRYKENMLELQAECFTIDLLGCSNHSNQNAKEDSIQDIKEILDCMWSYSLWDL